MYVPNNLALIKRDLNNIQYCIDYPDSLEYSIIWIVYVWKMMTGIRPYQIDQLLQVTQACMYILSRKYFKFLLILAQIGKIYNILHNNLKC